jgi:hypothetical protein
MKHNEVFFLEKRKDKDGQPITVNVPLSVRITFGGQRLFYFTGYRMDSVNFDEVIQQAVKNTSGMEGSRPVQYNHINRRIKAMRATLELHFQNVTATTKADVIALLDEVCKKGADKTEPEQIEDLSFFTMFESYINNSVLSVGRKKHIRTTINHWRKFEAYKGIGIDFDCISLTMLNDFERYLIHDSTKPIGKGKTVEVHSPKGLNTVVNIMKITRTFWRYARNVLKAKGIQLNYPFEDYKIKSEKYGEPIYITSDERNILFCASFHSERLQRVRDMFVFQSLIGARVGDMCKLTNANIIYLLDVTTGQKVKAITYIPRKTKDGEPVAVEVPLNSMAIEILSRYNLPDGRLLPYITDQRYNEYIKELFEVVGLVRPVTRLNPTTREPEIVRLCDIASSHMARRAFVGNLYGKVDNGIISSMSGHIEGSKAFTRYYKVSKELKIAAINIM